MELELNQISFEAVRKGLLALNELDSGEVTLKSEGALSYVLGGVRTHCKIQVEGDLGDFCAMSFGDAECFVGGNVGKYFAHSLQSGTITVRGHAKSSLGAMGEGGLLAVYGSAADRVGVALSGTDLIVRGSVGRLAGLGMRSGTIIIGGNAGDDFGKGMQGGTIYLRGEAAGISDDIEEGRMKESDRLKIGLLMLKAGIKANGKDFKVYRSVHQP